jgi:hypothetical protein
MSAEDNPSIPPSDNPNKAALRRLRDERRAEQERQDAADKAESERWGRLWQERKNIEAACLVAADPRQGPEDAAKRLRPFAQVLRRSELWSAVREHLARQESQDYAKARELLLAADDADVTEGELADTIRGYMHRKDRQRAVWPAWEDIRKVFDGLRAVTGDALRERQAPAPRQAQAAPTPPAPQPVPEAQPARLENWALGVEHGDAWHLFRRFDGRWDVQKKPPQPAKGLQAGLLKVLAKGGGALGREEANRLWLDGHRAAEPGKQKKKLKSEVSRLRKFIRRVLQAAGQAIDPSTEILWPDTHAGGWRAVIQIGYAVEGTDARLMFKTHEQLARGEAPDR